MPLFPKEIIIGSRASSLAKVQVQEVLSELEQKGFTVKYKTLFVETKGDKDKQTSLLQMEKSDFFTKELDALLLQEACDVTIHSAKDLPDPLPKGLIVVAYTKGVDPSDVLVFKDEKPRGALRVGTSSYRRIESVQKQLPNATLVDIRGTIEERLALLDEGKVDALVMAKAALIRLKKHRKTELLEGKPAPMQGRLAVVAREGDSVMKALFSLIDSL